MLSAIRKTYNILTLLNSDDTIASIKIRWDVMAVSHSFNHAFPINVTSFFG